MRALIEKYAKRLDALSRRERIMVFAAAAAVILALFISIGISPALERSKLLAARAVDQKAQVAAATAQQAELQRALKQDPDVAVRERIAERRKQIAEIDTQLAGLQRTLVPPQSMATVLEQLIGQDGRVRIVRLQNLPPAPLVERSPAAAGAAPTAGLAQTGDQHVFKHGVHVVVEGSYLDLTAYVARLEKQPWQVYWGRTVMSADYPKVQVDLTLYTLSLDKAWLVV
jgi:MSHA biogenesis protein MshJ